MTLGHIPPQRALHGRASPDTRPGGKARPPRLLGWMLAGLLSLGLWLVTFSLLRVAV